MDINLTNLVFLPVLKAALEHGYIKKNTQLDFTDRSTILKLERLVHKRFVSQMRHKYTLTPAMLYMSGNYLTVFYRDIGLDGLSRLRELPGVRDQHSFVMINATDVWLQNINVFEVVESYIRENKE